MYCKQCGYELESGDKFCRGCGAAVKADSEKTSQDSEEINKGSEGLYKDAERIYKGSDMIQTEEGSAMAVASMVCGIVGLLLVCIVIGIIPAIVAIVLAANVLRNNKPGKNMAVAGLVTGIIAAGIGGVMLML